MTFLRKLRNYFFYCGIDREEYQAIKKNAYISNFVIWRSLHFLIAATMVVLFITSILTDFIRQNAIIYIFGFCYSVIVIILFLSSEKIL